MSPVFERRTTGSVVCPSCGSLVGVQDDKCYSCGRANPYGHPTAPVMARYEAAGATVLRTDLNGQIEVTTDGLSLSAATFSGAISKNTK